MPTKHDDALSIAKADTVEEIEKELSLEMLEKSQIEELVTKSLKEKSDAEQSDLTGKTLEAVTDETIPIVDIAKSETPTPEPEIIAKDMGEEKAPEEYRPFGGATTFVDAQKFIDVIDLTQQVYKAYTWFGALVSNIMDCSDEMMDITAKIAALNKLVGEFKSVLTPDKLKELSESEMTQKTNELPDVAETTAVKSETDELRTLIANLATEIKYLREERTASVTQPVEIKSEVTETKSDVLDLSKEFDGMLKEALTLNGENRKAAMQGIINRIGETFAVLDSEISKSETVPTQTVVIDENMVKNVVQREMAAVSAQLEALTNLIKNQTLATKSMINPIQSIPARVPVQKSVTHLPQVPLPQVAAKGMSIRDIVLKTTTGQ